MTTCTGCSSRNFSAHTGGDGKVKDDILLENLTKYAGGILNTKTNRVMCWCHNENQVNDQYGKYLKSKYPDGVVQKFLSTEVKVQEGFLYLK